MPNHLDKETSPYLQQHANNPVDWYPWGEEALKKAKTENKPILLSIGYTACHWCHVMAHESFEDEEIARVMNAHFINIKVDREERPDLDKIYQTAQQLLSQQSGGWPLTMFLTPDDQMPFFGGTYFPKKANPYFPAFKDLLTEISEFYHQHPQTLQDQNTQLTQALFAIHQTQKVTAETLNNAPFEEARRQFETLFDGIYGGFGPAPKFPTTSYIERLLRDWAYTIRHGMREDYLLDMATITLKNMAEGGIYDQLGGGFFRYSVDVRWMIPHFEKMLYDNAQALTIYAEAFAATNNPQFKRIVCQTADWCLREMLSPEKAFYTSLSADSEGVEGRYYYWTPEQFKTLLEPHEYKPALYHFGLENAPNFAGHWHLYVNESVEEVAYKFQSTPEVMAATFDEVQSKLLEGRQARIRPFRDEKILTAWNALMIKGLSIAGLRLGREDYITAAENALDFVRDNLFVDGRLYAAYPMGKTPLMAYVDDYAFLLDAILSLLQARWRSADLQWAITLAEALLTYFYDEDDGGFWFTARDHEHLIQQTKTFMDESIPSGNGIAALVLQRLGYLINEPRYLAICEDTLKTAWSQASNVPHAHNSVLNALEEFLDPPQIVILRGEPDLMRPWQALCRETFVPNLLTFAIPKNAENLPEALVEKTPQDDVVAYICRGKQCVEPATTLNQFRQLL